jgi:hypothetical protein
LTVYSCCPKCGHMPLPLVQSLPAACPACGLILAKYMAAQTGGRREAARSLTTTAASHAESADKGGLAHFMALLVHVPPRVDTTRFWGRAALFVLFAIWGLRLMAMDFRDGEMFTSFLHGPLLVFHEAGHVVFRLLGEFMMFLGGTLGQLLMPAILAGALLIKNRDPFGASIGLWLVGVSFLDVAPYVYDSLDPQLMQLSGTTGEEGGHDWIYLLKATGLLKQAHGIGWFVHKLAAALVLISLAWGGFILLRQHKRLAGGVLNDQDL